MSASEQDGRSLLAKDWQDMQEILKKIPEHWLNEGEAEGKKYWNQWQQWASTAVPNPNVLRQFKDNQIAQRIEFANMVAILKTIPAHLLNEGEEAAKSYWQGWADWAQTANFDDTAIQYLNDFKTYNIAQLIQDETNRLATKLHNLNMIAKVITELCTTEDTYNLGLKTLSTWLDEQNHSAFQKLKQLCNESSLTSIYNTSKQLKEELEKINASDSDVLTKADAIASLFIGYANFFKAYKVLVNNIDKIQQEITDISSQKQPEITRILETFIKNNDGLDLSSIAIMPVQRVPRYKLLLEALSKEVSKSGIKNDNVIKNIEKSLADVSKINFEINEGKRAQESREALIAELGKNPTLKIKKQSDEERARLTGIVRKLLNHPLNTTPAAIDDGTKKAIRNANLEAKKANPDANLTGTDVTCEVSAPAQDIPLLIAKLQLAVDLGFVPTQTQTRPEIKEEQKKKLNNLTANIVIEVEKLALAQAQYAALIAFGVPAAKITLKQKQGRIFSTSREEYARAFAEFNRWRAQFMEERAATPESRSRAATTTSRSGDSPTGSASPSVAFNSAAGSSPRSATTPRASLKPEAPPPLLDQPTMPHKSQTKKD